MAEIVLDNCRLGREGRGVAVFESSMECSNLRDDTPLRTSGILDSVATLRLISFVEDRYGIEVEAHEAGVENFDRIDSIASFIRDKGGASG